MSTISSGTTSTTTLIHSGDTTGSLVFKTNDTGSGGTTALTLDTSQNATFVGKVTSAGALTLASNGTTTAMTIDTSQNVAFAKGFTVGATAFPAFSAYSNANQTVANVTGVVIAANVKEYDTGGCYNNTGSTVTLNGLSVPAYSFCPNVAGYYQISGGIQYGYTTCSRALIYLLKNGGTYKRFIDLNSNPGSLTGSSAVYLNGTGDYVSIGGYMGATGTLTFNGASGDTTLTWINGSMVRSA